MSELIPCPFCGGEAEIRERKVHHSDWFGKDYRVMYQVKCKKCGASVGKYDACLIHHDERNGDHGAVVTWNTRAERTCKLGGEVPAFDMTLNMLADIPWYWCLECGAATPSISNYCMHCGAKVVGE